MKNSIEARKNQLKAEIEFAKSKLEQNVDQLQPLQYLTTESETSQQLSSQLINEPFQAVTQVDMLTRSLLPQDNTLRHFFKYFNMGMKLFKMMRPGQAA